LRHKARIREWGASESTRAGKCAFMADEHNTPRMSVFRDRLAEFAYLCAASTWRTFPAHLPLYICALVFVPVTVVITLVFDAPLYMTASLFFLRTFPQFFVVGLFMAMVVQTVRLARTGSHAPFADLGAWFYARAVSGDRPGNMFHTLVTITPLMIAFTALKAIVPLIQPFSWDPVFERWDRVLFFGYAPWALLQPLLGYPVVTMALDAAYAAWFVVVFGVLVWQAFFAPSSLARMQYLLAFSLSWFIAGNILAAVFASAGPCYYGFLLSPDPYAAQMDYLRSVNPDGSLLALTLQDRVWQSYDEARGVSIGISAMPSMHVIAAVLTALVSWRYRKWLGVAATAYAAIVVIGSFHLAWHYAVDAIAGISLALLFWGIAGVVVRALDRLQAAQGRYSTAAVWPARSRE
jgi:hypothetical protein